MRAALLAAVLLLALPARADRYSRGLTIFQVRRCASCHTVGWKEPVKSERYKDLTRAIDARDDRSLKRWLKNPHAEKKGTGCHHVQLGDEEIAELIAFLHARAVTPPPRDENARATSVRSGGPARATTVVVPAKVQLAPRRSGR